MTFADGSFQPSLFDQVELNLRESMERRDVAIAQVETHADVEWKERARIAVRYLARTAGVHCRCRVGTRFGEAA